MSPKKINSSNTMKSWSKCRICDKLLTTRRALHISMSLNNDNTASTVADMMRILANVTITLEDDRSKHVCLECSKALEKSYQLREQIRANEIVIPTILQSIEIQDQHLSEQDYDLEYLDEFKDEIKAGLKNSSFNESLSSDLQNEGDDEMLTEQLNDQLYEEETDELQEYMKLQENLPFKMPSAKLIANRIEFENFEYLEIRGERCCGCAHIANTRDELMIHAKEQHSQDYFPDSRYTCPTCYQKFAKEEALKIHIQYYSYNDIFLCTICQKAFNLHDHLMLHMKQSHHLEQNDMKLVAEHPDPYTLKRKLPSSHNAIPLMLPDSKFIKSTREYHLYREYHFSGERCCACGLYMKCLESHTNEMHRNLNRDKQEPSNQLECKICMQTFTSRQQQMLHEEDRKNLNPLFECNQCKMLFDRKYMLLKHLRIAHFYHNRQHADRIGITIPFLEGESIPEEANVVECYCCCFTRCKEEFASEKELLDHAQETHKGRRKENEGKLAEHASEVLPNLVCPICQRAFDSEEKVKRHRTYKLTLPKQSCHQCGRAFMKASGLREHQIREHLSLKPEFSCETCGKDFVSRTTLNKHRRVHEPIKNYPCSAEGCTLMFRDEPLMRRHFRNVHMENKPYECSYCKKLFRTKESLDIHQRSHTGERPFLCRFEGCKKRYSHGTDRKRHERAAHTGEKPHTCPICSLGFLRKREMRLHQKKIHEQV